LAGYSSFGISDVDDLLGGGLLTGCSYLLEIEPGTEECAFIASFLEGGWRQRDLCALVTYDMPHEELIKRLTECIDVKGKLDSGALFIVDLWTEAKSDAWEGPIFMTSNPGGIDTMTRVSFELASQIPRMIQDGNFRGVRVVTYSLSSMIMNYKFEPTYKWTKTGLNLTRQLNITTLTILNPKMFDETTVAAFEHLNDGILVLSMKELRDKFQRYIRIKGSPIAGFSTRIVPYDIVERRPHLLRQSGYP
jgi:KaiC/GvpD/RAD55 family RecA-like ATPase